MTNWLTGWLHRKSHLITASAGAGTLYQTLIKVYKTTGTDGTEVINGVTAGKIYVGSNCRNDFGDIRFTDNDGDTPLDYWMDPDYLASGTSAVFWVEVADTLESDATIYVYYGKSDATTASSGPNTFIDFDDFEDGSIDGGWESHWETADHHTTVSEGNGKLTFTHTASAATILYFTKSTVRSVPIVVVAKIDVKTFGNDTKLFGPCLWRAANDNVFAGVYNYTGYQADIFINAPGTGSHDHATDTLSNNTIYEWWCLVDNSHGTQQYRDGANKVSATQAAAKKADGKIGIGIYYESTANNQVIDVTVWYARKYVAIGNAEPAHSTWGSEESTGNALNRTVVDSFGAVESKVDNVTKFFIEKFGALDTHLINLRELHRVFTEYLGSLDTSFLGGTLTRIIIEVFGATDTLIKSRWVYRIITEYLGTKDTFRFYINRLRPWLKYRKMERPKQKVDVYD